MRLALFGGTFDPIHQAHIAIAEQARDRFTLDRVLVIPAANPPHKRGANVDYEHRYQMVELACKGRRALQPSRLEAGEDRSYSIRTIEKVQREVGAGAELFFIIGADAFAEIGTWYRWEDVVRSVEFIAVARPAAVYEVPHGARVHPLLDVHLPVSSSAVRSRLQAGERPDEIDAAVYDYIVRHSLYR